MTLSELKESVEVLRDIDKRLEERVTEEGYGLRLITGELTTDFLEECGEACL
jgi:vacuolar-type H+-ATPase catalytic subunit A/Vma1